MSYFQMRLMLLSTKKATNAHTALVQRKVILLMISDKIISNKCTEDDEKRDIFENHFCISKTLDKTDLSSNAKIYTN